MKFAKFACSIILASSFSTLTIAADPIPKKGGSCPIGYYSAGDYCQPIPSSTQTEAIIKQGKYCPTGFYSAGDYCQRLRGTEKEAIPRSDSAKCPVGWYQTDAYCVK